MLKSWTRLLIITLSCQSFVAHAVTFTSVHMVYRAIKFSDRDWTKSHVEDVKCTLEDFSSFPGTGIGDSQYSCQIFGANFSGEFKAKPVYEFLGTENQVTKPNSRVTCRSAKVEAYCEIKINRLNSEYAVCDLTYLGEANLCD